MTVRWSEATAYQIHNEDKMPPNEYKVEYVNPRARGGNRWVGCSWTEHKDVIPATRYTMENLELYQEYKFCVRALYENLHGPLSTLSDSAMTTPKLGK